MVYDSVTGSTHFFSELAVTLWRTLAQIPEGHSLSEQRLFEISLEKLKLESDGDALEAMAAALARFRDMGIVTAARCPGSEAAA